MQHEHVTSGASRLWTASAGAGPPLVLCHGGPGLWDYLGPLAELTEPIATTYRYDQRGCGRSSGAGPHTIASHVADLEALREHFECERWIVGGHSWGAMLALCYALQYPQCCVGIVYISGVGINPSWRRDFVLNREVRLEATKLAELQTLRERAAQEGTVEAEREFCIAQWSCDFVDQATAEEHARAMLVDGVRVNNTVHGELFADAEQLCRGEALVNEVAALEVPALIIHGALDLRPHWPAQELACMLPRGEFTLLPDAGHFPWVEQPADMRALLHEFVARVAG